MSALFTMLNRVYETGDCGQTAILSNCVIYKLLSCCQGLLLINSVIVSVSASVWSFVLCLLYVSSCSKLLSCGILIEFVLKTMLNVHLGVQIWTSFFQKRMVGALAFMQCWCWCMWSVGAGVCAVTISFKVFDLSFYTDIRQEIYGLDVWKYCIGIN